MSDAPRLPRRRLLRVGLVGAGVVGAVAVSQRHLLELAAARAADAVSDQDRVVAARKKRGDIVKAAVAAVDVSWPPKAVFLRATKYADTGTDNGVVEVWVGNDAHFKKGGAPLKLALSHPICALSGEVGPKRKEGDGQIPEGFYSISALNPKSSFHLSLRVDYPNASDRARGKALDASARLGGDIMVHGSCVTIGCIPIQDDQIEEVYLIVSEAIGKKQPVPIHIFPRPMTDAALSSLLASAERQAAPTTTAELWRELHAGWAAFESSHRVPQVRIDGGGRYVVVASA